MTHRTLLLTVVVAAVLTPGLTAQRADRGHHVAHARVVKLIVWEVVTGPRVSTTNRVCKQTEMRSGPH